MILGLLVIALVGYCNGDVSHLDSNLHEDGYRYKQPSRPFISDKSGLDNNLSIDVSQQSSIKPQHSTSKPFQPAFDYLPPATIMPVPQTDEPEDANETPSQAEPAQEYVTPNVAPQPPPSSQSAKTQPNNLSFPQPATKETQQDIPQQSISRAILPKPILPRPAPEREYLPPGGNDINSEPESQEAYPVPQPTVTEFQPTYPELQTTYPEQKATYSSPDQTNQAPDSAYVEPQPIYAAPHSTYQTSQLTDFEPTNTESQTTYASPQPNYPESQTSYSVSQPVPEAPGSEESECVHELGLDGYKYKLPSKSFKY